MDFIQLLFLLVIGLFLLDVANGEFVANSQSSFLSYVYGPNGRELVTENRISFSCGHNTAQPSSDRATFDIVNDTSTRTIEVICEAPIYTFNVEKKYYVPLVTRKYINRVCSDGSTQSAVNRTDDLFDGDLIDNDNTTSYGTLMAVPDHKRKPLQAFLAGLAGAAAFNIMCNAFGGPSFLCPSTDLSGLKDMLASLGDTVSHLTDVVTDVQRALNGIQSFEINTQQEINKILDFDQVQIAINEKVQQQMQDIYHVIITQNSINQEIEHTMASGLISITNETNSIATGLEELYNFTLRGLQQTIVTTSGLSKRLNEHQDSIYDISTMLYHRILHTEDRRNLIRMVRRSIESLSPTSGTPFLRNLGASPMTIEERNEQRNLLKSTHMGSVTLQFTQQVLPDTTNYAYNVKYSLYCDTEVILNKTIPGTSILDLFRLYGPANCHLTDIWTCNCVIIKESSSCVTESGYLFPFQWAPATDLLYAPSGTSSTYTSHCTTTPFRQILEQNSHTIFTTLTEFYDSLYELCTSSVHWRTVGSYKVRIFSDSSYAYHNLTMTSLFDQGFDRCLPNITYLGANVQNNTDRLPFIFYVLLQFSSVVNSYDLYRTEESRIFGVLPEGLTFETTMLHNRVREDDTVPVDCTSAIFSTANNQKIPVYVISPSAVQKRVVIKLFKDEQTQETIYNSASSNFSDSSSSFLHPELGGNVVVTTNLLLSNDWSSLLPRPAEFFAGNFPYHDTARGNDMIFDFAPDLFSLVTPIMAPYKISYLSERVTDLSYTNPSNPGNSSTFITNSTSPFHQANWENNNADFYDAQKAGPSLLSTARVARTESGRWYCQESVDTASDGFVPITTRATSNNWCTRLSKYLISFNEDTQTLSMVPDQYRYEGTFNAPGGKLIQLVSTGCPSSYEVNIFPDGNSHILFYTTSNVPLTVTARVTAADRPGSSCNYDVTDVYSHSDPLRVELQRVETCSSDGVYVNVFQYGVDNLEPTESKPCYINLGIKVKGNFTSTVDNGQDHTIKTNVDIVNDDFQNQLLTVLNQMFRVPALTLQTILFASDLAAQGQAIEDIVNDIINQNTIIINAVNSSDIDINNKINEINQTAAGLVDLTNQVMDLIGKQRNDTAEAYAAFNRSQAAIDDLNSTLVQLNSDIALYNASAARLEAAIKVLLKRIEDQEAKKECFASIIPILGNVVCGLVNGIGSIFSGAFSWLGDIFSSIIQIVSIVLFGWILFKAVSFLLRCYQARRQGHAYQPVATGPYAEG